MNEIRKKLLMMKRISERLSILILFVMLAAGVEVTAQERSTSSGVTRRAADKNESRTALNSTGVSDRLNLRLEETGVTDADMAWMRVIYRTLDLEKNENAVLYYPVEPTDGQDNLFRLIIKLLAENKIPAYEFLDGREVFTDKYRLSPTELFDNFQIAWQEGKGKSGGVRNLVVDDSDIPAHEVLSYYVIEKWSLDRRRNRLMAEVEAICPVIHRSEEYGYEPARYPLCWIKYEDLKPYLMEQVVMMSDDNNMPAGTYADYFSTRKYKGEIYKTRNLRNRTLAEIYPDPDALKNARDSIERVLANFESGMWVPSLEELQARGGVLNDAPGTDSIKSVSPKASRSVSRRANHRMNGKKPATKVKPATNGNARTTPARSVRNRKR